MRRFQDILAEYRVGYETSLRERLEISIAHAALKMDPRGLQVSVDVECGDHPAAENTFGQIKCSLLALKPNGFVSSVRAY